MTAVADHTTAAALQAERAVIGAMFTTRDAADKARSILRAEDFFSEKTRTAFVAILDLIDAGHREPDMIILAEHLRHAGTLNDIGDTPFLDECSESPASAEHIESYARQVKEASLDRAIARQIAATAKEQTAANVSKLGELIATRQGLGAAPAFDFRTDSGVGLEAVLQTQDPGIPTGFPTLDEMLTLHPDDGDVLVVGARTSVGKTAFMTALSVNVAARGVEVLYLTTEMSTPQMFARILPAASGTPARKIRTHALNDRERRHLVDTCADTLSKLALKIVCKSRPSIDDIRAAIVAHRPRIACLDYLQRLKLGSSDVRAYAIGDLMADIKTMAQELRVQIVLGAQLDRRMDKAPTLPPTLSDLRDSGGIEHEADQVLLLWRPPESRPTDIAGFLRREGQWT